MKEIEEHGSYLQSPLRGRGGGQKESGAARKPSKRPLPLPRVSKKKVQTKRRIEAIGRYGAGRGQRGRYGVGEGRRGRYGAGGGRRGRSGKVGWGRARSPPFTPLPLTPPSPKFTSSPLSFPFSPEGAIGSPRPTPKLTPKTYDDFVKQITSRGTEGEILKILPNIDLSRKDLRRVYYNEWLNDNDFEAFKFLLLKKFGEDDIYFANTFYITKIRTQKNNRQSKTPTRIYDILKREIKKGKNVVNIFSFKRLIFPIHEGCHWTVILVDFVPSPPQIRFYDSLMKEDDYKKHADNDYINQKDVQNILWFLELAFDHTDEYMDDFHYEKFPKFSYLPKTSREISNVPKQPAQINCGIFSFMFMLRLAQFKDKSIPKDNIFHFNERDIFRIRTEILKSIFHENITKNLLNLSSRVRALPPTEWKEAEKQKQKEKEKQKEKQNWDQRSPKSHQERKTSS